jgi:hypothetical protein
MKLGDFFAAAPYARPVNPRPITFTGVAKGKILPNGQANPHGRPVAATITAAFMFLGGDGAGAARIEARRALNERFVDATSKIPFEIDAADLGHETVYQELFRVLHEWDSISQKIGARMFNSVENVRELIEPTEARRISEEYTKYVKEETFRTAEGGSPKAP